MTALLRHPLFKLLFAAAAAGVTYWSFLVEDAVGFQRPELARIFFWHFPCPILATVLLGLGAYFSLRIVSSKSVEEERIRDVRSAAAHELALVFIVLTLLSGIVFSRAQWGAWWQNDPRQTSFLLVTLVYLAYFGLRGALPEGTKRIRQSASYALVAFGPAMFLTFVFPRLPQIAQTSFHPTQSIMQGQIKGGYAYVLISVMVLATILAFWCYRLRIIAGLLELQHEEDDLPTNHERLAPVGRDSADSPVVRPLPLSDAGRS